MRRGQALAENLSGYHFMPGERGSEVQVLLTPGRVFRDGQIVNLQTPTPHEPRILARYQNQTLAPAVRKNRRSLIDSVGVIAKLALKGRTFTDRTVDQVAPFRVRTRINIRLVGNQKFGRRIGELTQDGLAADHHNVIVIGDGSRRSNDVLQLGAGHGWPARRGSNRE